MPQSKLNRGIIPNLSNSFSDDGAQAAFIRRSAVALSLLYQRQNRKISPKKDNMPQSQSSKSQVTRRSQMNKADMSRSTPASRPRDDLRTAYGGDENRGPAGDQKPKSSRGGRVKGKRLPADSAKTPVR